MKMLVTGGTGFLGRRFVSRALAEGHVVLGLARSDRAAAQLEALGASAVGGDLDDPPSVKSAFRRDKCDVLVNIASLGFGHAQTIIDAVTDAGLRRAIFVSTTAVTTTLPAASKRVRLAAEMAIRGSDLDWTIMRPTMIYGLPGDRNIARLLKFLKRARVVPLPGGGGGLQQPIHVDDLASALLVSASDGGVCVGRTYDLAGPTPMTFRELVVIASRAVGARPLLVPVPLHATMRIVALQERILPRPLIKSEQVNRLAEDKSFDIGRARVDLGFGPREFEAGVNEEATVMWP